MSDYLRSECQRKRDIITHADLHQKILRCVDRRQLNLDQKTEVDRLLNSYPEWREERMAEIEALEEAIRKHERQGGNK